MEKVDARPKELEDGASLATEAVAHAWAEPVLQGIVVAGRPPVLRKQGPERVAHQRVIEEGLFERLQVHLTSLCSETFSFVLTSSQLSRQLRLVHFFQVYLCHWSILPQGQTEKLSPHPHVLLAWGFCTRKPEKARDST